jgi:S1-C subfamily serine protease
MHRWPRVILLLAAVSLLAGCGDDDARFRAGVARLEVKWMGAAARWKSKSIGTAFFIGGQGYLLTARHVVDHGRAVQKDLSGRLPAQIVAILPGAEPVNVAIVAEDPTADVALLKVEGTIREPERRLRLVVPTTESEVVLAGFPIGEPELLVRRGRLVDPKSLRLTPEDFQTAQGWMSDLSDGGLLLAGVSAEVGDSGGPVYLAETGEVIGLCSATLKRTNPEEATDIALVVPAPRIARFLDAQGVSLR